MSRYRWDVDRSFSDGMCGAYAMVDTVTGRRERVYWSVTNPLYRSQEDARAEAIKRLETSAPRVEGPERDRDDESRETTATRI